MPDLRKVGAQLVVENADQSAASWEKNTQAANGYAEVLRRLVPLQAEQAIATVQQTEVVNHWVENLATLDAQYQKFWTDAGNAEQEGVVKNAQAAQETVGFWEKALKEQDALEQERTVKAAQAANAYVGFWEEALDKQTADFAKFNANYEKFLQEELAAEQEVARARQNSSTPAGSIFGDPARAEEMQRTHADNVRIAAEAMAEAQKIVNQTTSEASTLTEFYTKQLQEQGLTAKQVAATLKELGLAETNLSEAEMTEAEIAKVVASTHQRISQGYADEEKQINLLSKSTNEGAESHNRLTQSAVQSSRAFFALTLASFGLMSVSQELKKAFGDDLPPVFERFTSFAQQVASFGSAGAFVGGVPGAILGGITGAVIALGTAALQVDPQVQQLNQSLNNMSKQDETVKTLADVAGVTKDVAKEWEEAARKSPEFAKELELLVKKAEPLPPLLKAINQASLELTGTLDGLSTALGATGDFLNKFGVGVVAGGTGVIKLLQEIGAGKNVIDAWNEAEAATQRVMEKGLEATAEAGISQANQNRLTAEAQSILADTTKEAKKLADAQERLADATNQANFSLSQLAQRTANQYAQAQQQYSDAVADAADQRSNAVFSAEQTLTNRLADLWTELKDKVVDIQSSLADKQVDIASKLSDKLADSASQLAGKVFDIQTQLSNRIEDIQLQLANKIADIQQGLQNKLSDLAHRYAGDVEKANAKVEEAAKELARKLYEIERDRIESTERLAYDTHNRFVDARTDHDKERVLRDAQFEQSQIDQRANDARDDARNSYLDKVHQAELEKKLAEENYRYEVELAKRLAEQQIEDARRTAEQERQVAERNAQQQIAVAEREAAQQRAIAEREAAQQLAIAQRETQQQIALAQRRYAEETAQAQRAYAQQVEAARRAEQQRTADALRSLNERNTAIAQSAELERQQIQHTLDNAVKAYQRQIQEIQNLVAAVRVLIQNYLMLQGVIESIAKIGAGITTALFDDWIEKMKSLSTLGMTSPAPTGSTSTPPPLIPSLFGGSRVNTPSTTNTTSNSSMNIIINDATEPRKVAEVVRRELANARWR